MEWSEIFSSDPEVMSGALVFRGTRVPIEALFDNLVGGSTLEEILADFPSIGRARAEAAISLAVQRLRREAA